MADNIFKLDQTQQELWEKDENKAARLAYLQVLMFWGEQVERGEYRGVPAMHRVSRDMELDASPQTTPSRSPNYTRDSSAGSYSVPDDIRRRWLAAA